MNHIYRLKNTGFGSERFGACEQCGKPTGTTYIMSRYHVFHSKVKNEESTALDYTKFGHKTCLADLTI